MDDVYHDEIKKERKWTFTLRVLNNEYHIYSHLLVSDTPGQKGQICDYADHRFQHIHHNLPAATLRKVEPVGVHHLPYHLDP